MAEQATLTMAAYWQQRVCACCGEPGSEAHHVVLRSLVRRQQDTVDAVLLVCPSCHRAFHDGVDDVQAALGSALTEWPEKLDYVHCVLGWGAESYLRRYYRILP